MIAPMAAPRPPPNTPPMMAPVAPPTIAPPTGSCAAASCIGIASAMARQAEDPKARINPALLLISIEFHVEIWPNRGGTWKQQYHTERPLRFGSALQKRLFYR